ncbi:MAG: hypothetical protein P8Y69_13365 [Gammaproteobacteria bacterium]
MQWSERLTVRAGSIELGRSRKRPIAEHHHEGMQRVIELGDALQ